MQTLYKGMISQFETIGFLAFVLVCAELLWLDVLEQLAANVVKLPQKELETN